MRSIIQDGSDDWPPTKEAIHYTGCISVTDMKGTY